jgi:tripartite-type tricarboxylate transporter receptor subunit TctC
LAVPLQTPSFAGGYWLGAIALLPDVPTVAESGFPGFEAYNWVGVFAPAATPQAAIDRLQREFAAALREPDVLQRLAAVGFEIVGSTPQELDRFVRREFEHWQRFVREFAVKFD